jgi:hypothetical protein
MSLDTSDPKMSLHADPDKIEETPIKVAWLKQQKAEEEGTLPLLDFDEQQYFTFDRRHTTFRMVKHSCSYPAPPHKVRIVMLLGLAHGMDGPAIQAWIDRILLAG